MRHELRDVDTDAFGFKRSPLGTQVGWPAAVGVEAAGRAADYAVGKVDGDAAAGGVG